MGMAGQGRAWLAGRVSIILSVPWKTQSTGTNIISMKVISTGITILLWWWRGRGAGSAVVTTLISRSQDKHSRYCRLDSLTHLLCKIRGIFSQPLNKTTTGNIYMNVQTRNCWALHFAYANDNLIINIRESTNHQDNESKWKFTTLVI